MKDALSALDRAREINARMEAKRAEAINLINQAVALILVLCTVGFSAIAFGIPEQQRLDRINQEIAYHD
ncbi:hypothetical protein ACFFP0_24805 [Rhizobium puerariae]|uniref:Uncharacterized protein n=1 Tax=Rhizobium puerariae TaxID=1585791 RepID=A0ABV6AN80_9HYPH